MILGEFNKDIKKVKVIGAGVSGLLVSYYLLKNGFEVELIESGDHVGGLIQTKTVKGINGYVYGISETAAHSTLLSDSVKKLFDELNLEFIKVNEDSKARYVYLDKKLKKIPFQVLGFFDLIKLFFRLLFLPSIFKNYEKVSVRKFGNYFLGKKVTNYLLTPFVRGIYGVEPKFLNLKASFPKLQIPYGKSFLLHFFIKKLKNKSRTQKKEMVVLKNGMQSLTDALLSTCNKFNNFSLKLNTNFESVNLKQNLNETVFICTSAYHASVILKDYEISKFLKEIDYTPLISITAFVPVSSLKHNPKGVGCLMPEKPQNVRCLGVLFNSSSFQFRVTNPSRFVSFTLMYGGTSDLKVSFLSDNELRVVVKQDLFNIFGLQDEKLYDEESMLMIHRYTKALPQYSQKILALQKNAHLLPKNGLLFGNYTGEISIRGMIETLDRFF